MRKSAATSIVLAWILAGGLTGQVSSPAALSQTDKAIEDLRQITRDLNESVKTFYVHLDQAIARHDRGYRTENGRVVQNADADLIGGPSDVTWATIQKFFAFRLLATVKASQEVHDPAAADLERIQKLIVEARKRVDATAPVLRGLLVVSVADYVSSNDSAAKYRHDQLLRARGAAEEAAQKAMLALPLDQPDESAPEQTAQNGWDAMGRSPASARTAPVVRGAQTSSKAAAPVVPIVFERRKRVTVINGGAYRMAMTDSGIEDEQGRHIFYQEEWVQRGQSVIRYRWRVAVEAATGQHILLKRYPPRELTGVLEDVYGHRDRDYVWYLEPPDDSTEPTRDEIEAALADVTRAREMVHAASQNFEMSIQKALEQQDRFLAAVSDPPVDRGLPKALRLRLFAIRGHLAGVPAVLKSEGDVRKAISAAESSVRDLEPLAAWSNQIAKPGETETMTAADWAQILDRSDFEIDSLRNAEAQAIHALPPDSSHAEDQFPELEKNTIIRVRRPRSKNPDDKSVHCLQEIWRMDIGPVGAREVRRIVSLILIDPLTGDQTRVGGATRYYKVSDGDTLEEIFDEHAADEVSLGS